MDYTSYQETENIIFMCEFHASKQNKTKCLFHKHTLIIFLIIACTSFDDENKRVGIDLMACFFPSLIIFRDCLRRTSAHGLVNQSKMCSPVWDHCELCKSHSFNSPCRFALFRLTHWWRPLAGSNNKISRKCSSSMMYEVCLKQKKSFSLIHFERTKYHKQNTDEKLGAANSYHWCVSYTNASVLFLFLTFCSISHFLAIAKVIIATFYSFSFAYGIILAWFCGIVVSWVTPTSWNWTVWKNWVLYLMYAWSLLKRQINRLATQ